MICRLCYSEKLNYRDWGGVECNDCKSINPSYLPSQQELSDHYLKDKSAYYADYNQPKLERYSIRYLKFVKKYAKYGSLFDLGSASTPFPVFASKDGYKVTAGDINQVFQNNDGVNRITFNLNEPLESDHNLYQNFDIVTCFAVIEHTLNPRLTINNISKLVKPGGKIFISMPNIGEWYDWFSLGGSRWFDPPGHLHIISRKATILNFKQNNCKVLEHGVFELNRIRFIIRYSILFIEGIIGYIFKLFFNKSWLKMRNKNRTYGMGLSYFIFEKKY